MQENTGKKKIGGAWSAIVHALGFGNGDTVLSPHQQALAQAQDVEAMPIQTPETTPMPTPTPIATPMATQTPMPMPTPTMTEEQQLMSRAPMPMPLMTQQPPRPMIRMAGKQKPSTRMKA